MSADNVIAADWRALDAGLALDRIIATLRGWTNIEERSYWFDVPDAGPYEQAVLCGDNPNAPSYYIPDYSTDMRVWRDEHFALWWANDQWYASFDYQAFISAIELDDHHGQTQSATTPAHAVARAWLAAREGEGDEHE